MRRLAAVVLLLGAMMASPAIAQDATPAPPQGAPPAAQGATPAALGATPAALGATPAGAETPGTRAPFISDDGVFASSAALLLPQPDGPFPLGTPGEVAVVAHFPSRENTAVVVVLRNNMNAAVNTVVVSVRVAVGGRTVALGTSSNVMPAEIAPTGLALAAIPLVGDVVQPADIAAAVISVSASLNEDDRPFEPISMVDVVATADGYLAGLRNTGERATLQSEAVILICISGSADQPIGAWAANTFDEVIGPGESATVEQDLDSSWAPCDQYIAAAIGAQAEGVLNEPGTD